MRKQQQNSAFERSQRQIVVVMMAAFLVLFVATMAMIYFLSYQELYQDNQDMLETYVEQYRENGNPSETQSAGQAPLQENPPVQDVPLDHDSAQYLLSSFYSVAFDEDGLVFSIDMGSGTLYTESLLTEVAESILQEGKSEGTYGNFVFCVDTGEPYTLVVLMDNTLVSDSFTTLFRNALLLGAVMVVILFLCSLALARWIIHPLEEGDRRQKQFISDAGHELKTPVSVVEANAELLEREIGDNKWLANIRYENNRMAGLVNELLSLARMEQNEIPMESVDFSRLVLGEALPFESVAFESGRQLDYQIDEDIYLQGNPAQLGQLVSVLLDNALSYSTLEGNITIALHQERGQTVLTVSNPGFISEQDMPEIFDRFFRSDANRKDIGHYGLGLTIAKNIVAAHQGEISVDCVDGKVIFSVRFANRQKKRRKTSE